MSVERMIRMIAGIFIILSAVLGWFVSKYFFLFTVFVGVNLFQFSITNWCPMIFVLKKLGFSEK